jgi:hypothetical protein
MPVVARFGGSRVAGFAIAGVAIAGQFVEQFEVANQVGGRRRRW